MWGFLGGGHANGRGHGATEQPPAAPVSESRLAAERLARVCLEYLPEQLEAATDGFSGARQLGSGGAGTVYRGTLRDGSDVAVKVIDLAALGDDLAMSGFEEEVAVLSKFRHPNLVVLMGWARKGDSRFLVYEFLPGGDVGARLRHCQEVGGKHFLWKERLSVALDAATGLAHLHNATPEAFHRDIKPPNILIGAGGAKVADFGLSCVSESKNVAKGSGLQCELPSGTPGYSCPHYLASRVITEAREVYSFGVVLLELLLNMPAATRLNGVLAFPIEDAVMPTVAGAPGRVMAALDRTAAWPPQIAHEIAQLALACVSYDEDRRPSFNQVCRSLRSLRDRPPDGTLAPLPQHVMAAVPTPNHQVLPPVGRVVPVQPGFAALPRGSGVGGVVVNGQQPMVGLPQPVPVAVPGPKPAGVIIGGPSRAPSPAALLPRPAAAQSPGPQLRAVTPCQGVAAPVVAAVPGPGVATPPRGGSVAVPAGRLSIASGPPAVPAGGGHATGDLTVEAQLPASHASALTRACLLPLCVEVLDCEGRRRTQLGRQHQTQCLEELIGAEMCCCISRTVCEIAWGGGAGVAAVLKPLPGANPLLVDGFETQPGVAKLLRQRSQVVVLSQDRNPLVNFVVTLPPGGASVASPASAPPVEKVEPPIAALPDKGNAWRVECIKARGFGDEQLRSLPAHLRAPDLPLTVPSVGQPIMLGRQHQPEMFQALLEHQPELCAQVSRSHLRLEALQRPGSSTEPLRLQITNIGQNPVLVCGNVVVSSGEVVQISDGQTLGFAAPVTPQQADSNSASLLEFLTFQFAAPRVNANMPAVAAALHNFPIQVDAVQPAQAPQPDLQAQQHPLAMLLPLPRPSVAQPNDCTAPQQLAKPTTCSLQAQPPLDVAKVVPRPVQVAVPVESVCNSATPPVQHPVLAGTTPAAACIAEGPTIDERPREGPALVGVAAAMESVRAFGMGSVPTADRGSVASRQFLDASLRVTTTNRGCGNLGPELRAMEQPFQGCRSVDLAVPADSVQNVGTESAASSRTHSPREQDRSLADVPELARSPTKALLAGAEWPQVSPEPAAPTVCILPGAQPLDGPIPSPSTNPDPPVGAATASTLQWQHNEGSVLQPMLEEEALPVPTVAAVPSEAPEGVSALASVPTVALPEAGLVPRANAINAAPVDAAVVANAPTERIVNNDPPVRAQQTPPQPALSVEHNAPSNVGPQDGRSAERRQVSALSSASTAATAAEACVTSSAAVKLEVLTEHVGDVVQADSGGDSPEAGKRPRGGCRCFRIWGRRRSKA